MFEEGEYIVYGNTGVCKVLEVGPLDVTGSDNAKLYYTLSPVYSKSSKVYTPTDNAKVVMRPVISKEEAIELIEDIKNIDKLEVKEEKRIEDVYKAATSKCDCRQLIMIIKTLYTRRQIRIADGKKITTVDERYLRLAEDNLFGELSISLDMDKDKVEEYISSRFAQ